MSGFLSGRPEFQKPTKKGRGPDPRQFDLKVVCGCGKTFPTISEHLRHRAESLIAEVVEYGNRDRTQVLDAVTEADALHICQMIRV